MNRSARDLREQIAAYLLESRGVKTDADSIIIGSSTQQMLIYLSRILKEDFSGMIVEDPGFDGARAAFQFHGPISWAFSWTRHICACALFTKNAALDFTCKAAVRRSCDDHRRAVGIVYIGESSPELYRKTLIERAFRYGVKVYHLFRCQNPNRRL